MGKGKRRRREREEGSTIVAEPCAAEHCDAFPLFSVPLPGMPGPVWVCGVHFRAATLDAITAGIHADASEWVNSRVWAKAIREELPEVLTADV